MMRWMRVPFAIVAMTLFVAVAAQAEETRTKEEPAPAGAGHVESPRDLYVPPAAAGISREPILRSRGGHVSVQVNVDAPRLEQADRLPVLPRTALTEANVLRSAIRSL